MTPTKSNYGQQRSAEVHARNAARKAAPAAPAKTAASAGRVGTPSAPAMPTTGRPMKKGGAVIDGVAKKGKTKGKMVAMKRGGKC